MNLNGKYDEIMGLAHHVSKTAAADADGRPRGAVRAHAAPHRL